ncbi:hypothetical protein GCM10007079_20430 [Nocardiopsis terrae]|nr:hypothetical protein GCM10007079_20430 [Nocardiopsis terrae]
MFPGDPVHDTELPARDRLVACLRQLLAPAGTGEEARKTWATMHETYFAREPTEEARQAYLVIERRMRHRVEHWLSVLGDEGALPRGDNAQRAEFLLTLVNGLMLERSLPGAEALLTSETAPLFAAADSVLRGWDPCAVRHVSRPQV